MLTAVCEKNIIPWVFPTTYKRYHVRIIRIILTTLKNEKFPWERVRVDEYGAWKDWTDFTKLLVDDFNIYMGTIGGDAS